MLLEQRGLFRRPLVLRRTEGLHDRRPRCRVQFGRALLQHLLEERVRHGLQAGFQCLDLALQALRRSLVFLPAGARGDRDHAIVRLGPTLRTVRRVNGVEDGLEPIVFVVPDRLEFVRVTAGALDGDPQQAIHGVLQIAFQHGEAIDSHFVRVAVALAGAVRGVAEEVRRLEQLDRLAGDVAAGRESGHFVAGELLLHEAVVRLVLVEGADHVVAVAIGERPVAVGVEVAVGVRIAGGVEPVLAPALAVMGRGQVPFDHALISVGRCVRQKRRRVRGRGR